MTSFFALPLTNTTMYGLPDAPNVTARPAVIFSPKSEGLQPEPKWHASRGREGLERQLPHPRFGIQPKGK